MIQVPWELCGLAGALSLGETRHAQSQDGSPAYYCIVAEGIAWRRRCELVSCPSGAHWLTTRPVFPLSARRAGRSEKMRHCGENEILSVRGRRTRSLLPLPGPAIVQPSADVWFVGGRCGSAVVSRLTVSRRRRAPNCSSGRFVGFTVRPTAGIESQHYGASRIQTRHGRQTRVPAGHYLARRLNPRLCRILSLPAAQQQWSSTARRDRGKEAV